MCECECYYDWSLTPTVEMYRVQFYPDHESFDIVERSEDTPECSLEYDGTYQPKKMVVVSTDPDRLNLHYESFKRRYYNMLQSLDPEVCGNTVTVVKREYGFELRRKGYDRILYHVDDATAKFLKRQRDGFTF